MSFPGTAQCTTGYAVNIESVPTIYLRLTAFITPTDAESRGSKAYVEDNVMTDTRRIRPTPGGGWMSCMADVHMSSVPAQVQNKAQPLTSRQVQGFCGNQFCQRAM